MIFEVWYFNENIEVKFKIMIPVILLTLLIIFYIIY